MLVKDAEENDILETKRRIKERQKQRRLERDAKQAIEMVNKHTNRVKKQQHKKEY